MMSFKSHLNMIQMDSVLDRIGDDSDLSETEQPKYARVKTISLKVITLVVFQNKLAENKRLWLKNILKCIWLHKFNLLRGSMCTFILFQSQVLQNFRPTPCVSKSYCN